MTPRLRVAAACERYGTDVVVRACVDLIEGRDADPALVVALGGPHAEDVLAQGSPPVHRYWLRTWGARGLLHAWDPGSTDVVVPALVRGCTDEAWRVREMVCKVVTLRGDCGDDGLFDAVAGLRDDEVPRVRAAADRAVARLAATG